MVPSESDDAAPLTDAVSPLVLIVNEAVGSTFSALMTISFVTVFVSPALSVIVSVTS